MRRPSNPFHFEDELTARFDAAGQTDEAAREMRLSKSSGSFGAAWMRGARARKQRC